MFFDPVGYIHDVPSRNITTAVLIVDKRADLMDDIDIRDKAFDPYAYMRDSYMQNRENLVKDGADSDHINSYTIPLGGN